ncbi:ActS/PrrB/RegB family redox-sensitive histidine kinase [Frigidibacter sp. RF13]|uniref:sensor histidine kinase RegB n=1 Tax=Frigidibacter sp. RF13 TaxID=2997340 RepID=UPI00226E79B4|nr:ActS/PrrB/RegB family redox-sensitive histidine kinase [Frigidibacter sp. RF13]MCY1126457.1 ActS/PrrB/RegB family redox-sensitive histidine kinase [Frigidibacter sp. RF13]
MSKISAQVVAEDAFASRSDWVRLRTLVILRWTAVAGQLAAMFAAWRFYGIDIPAAPCLAVVGLSVAVNLASNLLYAETHRLTEFEALTLLAFDSCQLTALLYLTGGLGNPFALLLLVPATIAATALNGLSIAILGGLTVILVSLLAVFHLPLRYLDGAEILVPAILANGFWLAIVIGVAFMALYTRRVSGELHAMTDALLATQMALAREQTLTDLSGVVAAAAHELGTPLATIKLAASELADDLSDRPDQRADAVLIGAQADRCRDILRSMGRAGKDDLQMRAAPFQAIVEEAAEPHRDRKANIAITIKGDGQPVLARRPEIIHGLRNLIQNAVDFSNGAVWIDLDWTADRVLLAITDDGPGFPPALLGRIGDPFVRDRGRSDERRPQYEGMGLGLFIAKTLLERTGARLEFSNASDPFLATEERPARCGALVRVSWPRERVEIADHDISGQNQPF